MYIKSFRNTKSFIFKNLKILNSLVINMNVLVTNNVNPVTNLMCLVVILETITSLYCGISWVYFLVFDVEMVQILSRSAE